MNQSSNILQTHLDRILAGDLSARSDLLQATHDRLVRLARRMLKDFPNVKRWEDTDDVFQNAAFRLHTALGDVTPPYAFGFFPICSSSDSERINRPQSTLQWPTGIGREP